MEFDYGYRRRLFSPSRSTCSVNEFVKFGILLSALTRFQMRLLQGSPSVLGPGRSVRYHGHGGKGVPNLSSLGVHP